MLMIISSDWKDYKCIASGDGEKIEKWGNIILRRPDPQAIWPKSNNKIWNEWDAIYHRSSKGGGSWEYKKKLPEYWTVKYKELKFRVSPTNFKHTGIFAYTGCASMAASYAGASEVVHVDASRGMVEWAKENRDLCGLTNNKIRFIVDDVIKFLEREKRRGRTYHAIIMDPPSYGRGPNGEVWRLEDNLSELLNKAKAVLDDDYSFLLINSYTTGFSSVALNNILKLTFKNNKIETGEIGLPVEDNDLILPCGIYGRVTKD